MMPKSFGESVKDFMIQLSLLSTAHLLIYDILQCELTFDKQRLSKHQFIKSLLRKPLQYKDYVTLNE